MHEGHHGVCQLGGLGYGDGLYEEYWGAFAGGVTTRLRRLGGTCEVVFRTALFIPVMVLYVVGLAMFSVFFLAWPRCLPDLTYPQTVAARWGLRRHLWGNLVCDAPRPESSTLIILEKRGTLDPAP